MATTTHIAPSYGWRIIVIALLCLVFGAWGVLDLVQTVPQKQKRFDHYTELARAKTELEAKRDKGASLSAAEIEQYKKVTSNLNEMDKNKPVPPSKMDWLTQWFYASLLLCVPPMFNSYLKVKRQVYTLDDDGTLHFQGDPEHPSGSWPPAEIADIDMSRWMAKSIAYAVHTDGRRLKLDAYHHRNLDLIIGAIASRLHPEDWQSDARPVKKDAAEAPAAL
jgi:hypothetical protein